MSALKRIHFLRVCRTAHLPRDIGLTTYTTKIGPVLEYASPVWGSGGGLPIYLEEDLRRVQNRCLNVIGLPGDTVESIVTRRQNLTRKEFKRILESEAHPCKRFLDVAIIQDLVRLTQRTSEYLYHALLGTNIRLFLEVLNLT